MSVCVFEASDPFMSVRRVTNKLHSQTYRGTIVYRSLLAHAHTDTQSRSRQSGEERAECRVTAVCCELPISHQRKALITSNVAYSGQQPQTVCSIHPLLRIHNAFAACREYRSVSCGTIEVRLGISSERSPKSLC